MRTEASIHGLLNLRDLFPKRAIDVYIGVCRGYFGTREKNMETTVL